jgi:hypothetical protein
MALVEAEHQGRDWLGVMVPKLTIKAAAAVAQDKQEAILTQALVRAAMDFQILLEQVQEFITLAAAVLAVAALPKEATVVAARAV